MFFFLSSQRVPFRDCCCWADIVFLGFWSSKLCWWYTSERSSAFAYSWYVWPHSFLLAEKTLQSQLIVKEGQSPAFWSRIFLHFTPRFADILIWMYQTIFIAESWLVILERHFETVKRVSSMGCVWFMKMFSHINPTLWNWGSNFHQCPVNPSIYNIYQQSWMWHLWPACTVVFSFWIDKW